MWGYGVKWELSRNPTIRLSATFYIQEWWHLTLLGFCSESKVMFWKAEGK